MFKNPNIPQFSRNIDGILDSGNDKKIMEMMHLDAWKDNEVKSDYISMISHVCSVSQLTHFYEKNWRFKFVASFIFGKY